MFSFIRNVYVKIRICLPYTNEFRIKTRLSQFLIHCPQLMITNIFCSTILIHQISRQKTLLKRRRKATKKNKVAKKTLKEQDPKLSYAHELKVVQVQQELDRRVSRNTHINELMDQIFYPDVRYANERALENNFMKIAASPRVSNSRDFAGTSDDSAASFFEYVEEADFDGDMIVEQLKLCQIPSELCEFYLQNSERFTKITHVLTLLDGLSYYFHNREAIKQTITLKWEQSVNKLRIADSEKQKKRKRCPVIFIEKEDLMHDELWAEVIRNLTHKIQNTYGHGNEFMGEQMESGSKDLSFYSLESDLFLAVRIFYSIGYIPDVFFNAVMQKVLYTIGKDDTIEETFNSLYSLEILEKPIHLRLEMSLAEKRKLLMFLNHKNQTKTTLTRSVRINSPTHSLSEQQKIIIIGKSICKDILKSSDCNRIDLKMIMSSVKGFYSIMSPEILELAEPLLIRYMSSNTLENSIEYFLTFCTMSEVKEMHLLSLLKYDIYRKLPQLQNIDTLFLLLKKIQKDCRIYIREGSVSISMSDIYPRIIESFVKYVQNKGSDLKGAESNRSQQLDYQKVITLVQSIYWQFPKWDLKNYRGYLQLLATHIVKTGADYKLEELSEMLFRITLMGHKSKVFSRYVLQRFTHKNSYLQTLKKYRKERTLLLDDSNASSQQETEQNLNSSEGQLPNLRQVRLQQCLIMTLWSLLTVETSEDQNEFQAQQSSLPLDSILQILPIQVFSGDAMINSLVEDLNLYLEEFNMFPKIQGPEYKKSVIKNPQQNRHRQYKQSQKRVLTNRFEDFAHGFHSTVAAECVQRLSHLNALQNSTNNENFDSVFQISYLMGYCLSPVQNKKDLHSGNQVQRLGPESSQNSISLWSCIGIQSSNQKVRNRAYEQYLNLQKQFIDSFSTVQSTKVEKLSHQKALAKQVIEEVAAHLGERKYSESLQQSLLKQHGAIEQELLKTKRYQIL